jgi:hypothetical protein
MALLTNPQAILDHDDDQYAEVEVPEWGGSVRVRSIGAAERENLLRSSVTVEGKSRKIDTPVMRVKIVWLSVVDESNKRMWTTKAELEALGQKNAASIDRIADVALRLAGITDDTDDDEGKAPSSTTPSDSSSS